MSSSTALSPRCGHHTCRMHTAARFTCLCITLCFVSPGCTRPPDKQPPSPPAGSLSNNDTRDALAVSNPPLSTAQANVQRAPTDVAARLALAKEYFDRGETFAGIEQWEIVRALGSADSSVLRDLAHGYDAVGEPEAAAETLAAAHGSQELALPLAEIYLKLGDFQRSAQALKPLRADWQHLPDETRQTIVRGSLLAGDAETILPFPAPQTEAGWQSLAGLRALVAGDATQAVTALGKALESSPRDAWTGYLLGRAWLAGGDNKRALAAWTAVLQMPDAPPQAFVATALLLAATDRLDQADNLLDHVQGEDRKLTGYWQAAALIAQKRHRPELAQISLGYAAYNAGDPWRAEALWQGTLAKASDELARQAYAALSNSAARRQDAEAALRYAAGAAERWPHDPDSLRQHAEMLLAQNQPQAALREALRFQSVTSPERQAQAAELLARIALDAGKPEILTQNAQRARTLAPADPLPLLRLAEWQGQQGHDPLNLDKTLAFYQEARRVAPANAEAAARAGLVLADLKRTEEAITTLLHALTLSPRVLDGAPSALLAQLYRKQGKTRESQFEARHYQRVRALKETWPTLLKLLRQTSPAPGSRDWQALGAMALRRHENWIALCAFTRRVRIAADDPSAWRELAAAQKRFGWFDEALASMRRAHLLSVPTGKRAMR